MFLSSVGHIVAFAHCISIRPSFDLSRKWASSFPLEAKGKKARSKPSEDENNPAFSLTSTSRSVNAKCPGSAVPVRPFVLFAFLAKLVQGPMEEEFPDLGTSTMPPFPKP